MDVEVLKTVGQVAGIGGLAIGAFTLLFKELLKRMVPPQLSKDQWYKVVLIFMILVWSIGALGIITWAFATLHPQQVNKSPSSSRGPSAIEYVDKTFQFYKSFVSYQGHSKTIITVYMNRSNTITLVIDLDVAYEKFMKCRVDAVAYLAINGLIIVESRYQLVAKDSIINIYHVDKREYLTITNALLDVLQLRPENEPLKQLAFSLLKPYHFILNADKARLFAISQHYDLPVYIPPRVVLRWKDVIRAADKWPRSPNEPPQYIVPVEVVVDEEGLVIESRALLTDLFRFIGSNTNLLNNLGSFGTYLLNPISVEAKTTYSNIKIDREIPDENFDFRPEKDAKAVSKLQNPLPKY